MALTRIELNGRLLKGPTLGVTPGGRAVLRLNVDCGEAGAPLLLEIVVMDEPARDLARCLSAGQWIRAVGSLKAVRRGTLGGSGYQQFEVVASEVHPGQNDSGSGKDHLTASRALFSAKV